MLIKCIKLYCFPSGKATYLRTIDLSLLCSYITLFLSFFLLQYFKIYMVGYLTNDYLSLLRNHNFYRFLLFVMFFVICNKRGSKWTHILKILHKVLNSFANLINVTVRAGRMKQKSEKVEKKTYATQFALIWIFQTLKLHWLIYRYMKLYISLFMYNSTFYGKIK